jgi:hypothetical protein
LDGFAHIEANILALQPQMTDLKALIAEVVSRHLGLRDLPIQNLGVRAGNLYLQVIDPLNLRTDPSRHQGG